MARLYADEDFPLPVVERLRQLGHDVVTTLEAGQANQGIGDADQLAFATTLGRAILTRNRRRYVRLHTRYHGDRIPALIVTNLVHKRPHQHVAAAAVNGPWVPCSALLTPGNRIQ